MSDVIKYSEENGIGTICLDDGRANAMQMSWCGAMNAVLDRVEASDVSAVVMTGREGVFSGGLDLKLLPTLPPRELRETTSAFIDTMERVFLFPKPVIAASSGHAIAGGMMLFLAADLRVALDDDRYRYGLNEVTNGIPLLGGTVGICQYAIPKVFHTEFILHGRIRTARECFERQVVHVLCDSTEPLLGVARARAEDLRDVDLGAYRTNKLILRQEAFDHAVEITDSLMSEAPESPKGNVFTSMKR